jgi:hypothetical protein
MPNITPFAYEGEEVRFYAAGDSIEIVASDLAKQLGYRMASDMTRHLDEDEKGTRLVRTPGGEQEIATVTEAGMYRAIVTRQTGRVTDESRRTAIRAFQRWVTHEVLPAIRRTGIYAVEPQPQLSGKELLAAAVLEAAETIKQHEATIAQQAKELEAAAPKARTWDLIVSGDGSYTITDAAKTLASAGVQTGPRILHRQLAEAGWLYKNQRNRWVAYQDRLNSGDLVEKPRPYIDEDGVAQLATPQVRITAKGLAALRELLTVEDGAA